MQHRIDRDDLRRRAMALQAANAWTRNRAAKEFGVSDQSLLRMERNGDRWHGMAEQTVQRLADGVSKAEARATGVETDTEPVIIKPQDPAPEPTLPVARHTGMLNERMHGGREVYTVKDVADALGVTDRAVYYVLDRRADELQPGRDTVNVLFNGVSQVHLTRRGAMRVAMHSHGPNSLALQNHLLDLDEAVSVGQHQPVPEVDRVMAQVMAAFAGQMGAQFNAVQNELTQVKALAEQAKQATDAIDVEAIKLDAEAAATDAKRREERRKQAAIASLATWVEKLVALRIRLGIHANTKVGRRSAYSTVNGGVNDRYGVAGRSYLDADQAEDAIAFIQSEYHRTIGGAGQRVIDFPGA